MLPGINVWCFGTKMPRKANQPFVIPCNSNPVVEQILFTSVLVPHAPQRYN